MKMIIEGMNKASRKEFKAMLKEVKGLMFKARGKDVLEVVYVCLELEEKVMAVKAVRSALAEVRRRTFELADERQPLTYNHLTKRVF